MGLAAKSRPMRHAPTSRPLRAASAAWFLAAALRALGDDASSGIAEQLRLLQQQNAALQQQLHQQQQVIEELGRKVDKLQAADLGQREADTHAAAEPTAESLIPARSAFNRIHLRGEGAVAFSDSQANGQFPNHEFRVDEARLYLEAPIWGEVYFFGELNLYQREEHEIDLRAGEVFIDAENLSKLWGEDRQLNLRAGRFNIPFGEEYLLRHAIDNPLISHSVTDLWGVNEGLEVYGALGPFRYVAAVQNGPYNVVRDFNGDKTFTGRLAYEPFKWLHLSGSALRTGQLDIKQDKLSALWIGSGFVRPIGSAAATVFQADLLEGDLQLRFAHTTLKAAGGLIRYEDNDQPVHNRRRVTYYYAEAVQDIYGGLYAAARWSQVFAPGGYPIAGIGNVGEYAFGPDLTSGLHLLSLGIGYRWSPQLVLKVEYSIEGGSEAGGTPRRLENMLSATAAFAF